jgi:hypothetical protein
MARRHFPTCEGCGGLVLEQEVVEGRDDAGIHYFHKSHAPGAGGRKNPAKKNIFFRHRLKERRMRRQLEQAASVATSQAALAAAKKNIFFRHRLKERRMRRQLEQAASVATSQAALAAAQKNPYSRVAPGFVLRCEECRETFKTYRALTKHQIETGHVDNQTVRKNPAARGGRRGRTFRGRLASAKGRVDRFGRKHQRGVRIAKTAGKVGIAAASAVVPEVGVATAVGERGLAAYRARKGRKNPTPPRGRYISEQLDRAERYISAGRTAEAVKYIERAARMVDAGRGDPDEDAQLRKRVRTIEEAVTMSATPKETVASERAKAQERAAIKASEHLRTLELPSPPPDPDDEFFGALAEAAKREFPGRDLKDAVGDLQRLYHYALTNAAKRALVADWNANHTLGVNPAFWRVYEAYLHDEFEEKNGRLIYRGPGGSGVVHKNPSFKDIQPPVVEGAKALKIEYLDRNGERWVHDFGEDNLKPKLRVKKGLLSDSITISPTTVGPRGIGDDRE